MEIIIKSDNLNKLLSRRELNLLIKYEGATPSRMEIKEKLAALINVDLDLTLIQKISSKYGQEEANCIAKVYFNRDQLEKIEEKYIISKNNKKIESEEKEESN